ncbi:uncharacterized protein [Argopecten irradians]|uniref:uncharacterized protein n=1 Tax=Argopecten irradians TaxID=31199 RepID=UPI00371037ED
MAEGTTDLKGFKRKKGEGSYCCVPECHNQSGSDTKKRSYYRFPPEGSKQFKLWMTAIRRDQWIYKSWNRICSDHFINGEKGLDPSHPGYVPTIFPFKKQPNSRKSATSSRPIVQYDLKQQSTPRKKKKSETTAPNYFSPDQPEGHDYLVTKEIEVDDSMKQYLPEIEEKIKELTEIKTRYEAMKIQLLNIEEMKDSPKDVQFWTGFPNYSTFLAVYAFLEPRARTLKYWKGQSTIASENFSKSYINKPGPDRKLSLKEEFFLTMIRLKVGLLTEDLAKRFNVSTGSISSIFTSWVNLMYTDLKLLCELPSGEILEQNQSHAMGSTFQDVRVILDCTELFVQNPSKLDARKQAFSNYKHHMTYKFLVGISPQMGVTYVSKMYGGRASDKFITSDSENLLHNLEENKGSVMADRGFLIEGIMNDMGVKLLMPSFKGQDRPQLTSDESLTSEKVSKTRIHIERAIQRIKTYHILDGELKLSMKDIAEQVLTVCAYLVNFQSPIIKER